MKKLVLAASVAALLAACDQAAEESNEPMIAATDIPPSETSTAGTYDVTLPDGTKGTSTLNEDGRYSDRFGEQAENGTWAETGGKVCYDPDGDETPTRCYTAGEPEADGTFVATPDVGAHVRVKKIS